MDPDNFKEAWQTQTSRTRLTIDADLLLKEVQRNQQAFTCMILWRDVREVGISLLLVPVWFFLGAWLSLPWTWYLTVPALLWIAGFMLADRMRHKRRPPEPGEPLRQCMESSLAQVEHQIWLLRNVLWWYLLPLTLPMLIFFCHNAWDVRARGLPTAHAVAVLAVTVIMGFIVDTGIYWLNQYAVRCNLVPRRQELEALLTSLEDEVPA